MPIIQQGENLLVDARIIHQKLKSKQQFSDWIKNRIADYGFKKMDFLILGKSTWVESTKRIYF
ncbi:MAG: antA/AntB antirepressor family protein [Bacteroidetes bacterium]|nr:antA/AntB antirepressor family protein [Bacteroidota bacterium]